MEKLKLFIIAIAIALRLIFAALTIDFSNMETWEYGVIAKNISSDKSFSLFYFDDDRLSYRYSIDSDPFASAYMPPGYIASILPFYYLFDNPFYINISIILLNLLFDILSMLLLYRLINNNFSKNAAIISLIFFAMAPDFIYASTRAGTSSAFIFLSLLLFFILSRALKYRLIYIPLTLSLMIYFRSESVVLAAFVCIYIFFKEKKHHALLIFVICAALILPWQIRNIYQFNKFIPLTTSSGLNFYRGNNPYYPGFWADENIRLKILKLERNNNFEIALNDLYFAEAFSYISEKPLDAISKIPQKLFNLFLFDLNDKRTANPLYILSHSILIGLFLIFIIIRKNKFDQIINFFYLYIIFFTITCSVFFALPRYQTMMKTAIIPIAAIMLNQLLEKYLFKRKLLE